MRNNKGCVWSRSTCDVQLCNNTHPSTCVCVFYTQWVCTVWKKWCVSGDFTCIEKQGMETIECMFEILLKWVLLSVLRLPTFLCEVCVCVSGDGHLLSKYADVFIRLMWAVLWHVWVSFVTCDVWPNLPRQMKLRCDFSWTVDFEIICCVCVCFPWCFVVP